MLNWGNIIQIMRSVCSAQDKARIDSAPEMYKSVRVFRVCWYTNQADASDIRKRFIEATEATEEHVLLYHDHVAVRYRGKQ